MIRLALLSFWHVHAKDYVSEATQHPKTEIVAVWDEQPDRGRALAQAHQWHFYAQLDDLLRQSDIAGVIVTAPTVEEHLKVRRVNNAAGHWTTEPLPEDEPSPFVQWVASITAGRVGSVDLALAHQLTTLIAAAYRSVATRALVDLTVPRRHHDSRLRQ